jgi:L-asparaginase II
MHSGLAAVNPVLVEVRRGDQVESFHRGAVAVVNAGGDLLAAWGDVERPIFPRSAVKMIQALPLIVSRAAARFALTDVHIALACASHSGEPGHVHEIGRWLGHIGLTTDALSCGTHPPLHEKAARDLAATGQSPSPLHDNCSGKHTGFLTTALHLGVPVEGYVAPGHPVQRVVTQSLADMTECNLDDAPPGIDGCGIPAYALPLRAIAFGMAKLASPERLDGVQRAAASRILAAVSSNPWHVAGTGRFDTRAMRASEGAFVVKTGAEGVHVAGIRRAGLGIALKIDDGARRAAELTMGTVLRFLGLLDGQNASEWERQEVLSRRGQPVGVVASAAAWLADAERSIVPLRRS